MKLHAASQLRPSHPKFPRSASRSLFQNRRCWLTCFGLYTLLAFCGSAYAQQAMLDLPSECVPVSGKTPPWFRIPPWTQANIETFTARQYYKDWLSTTTTLCTDISQAKDHNPDYPSIVWRDDRQPLFRGGTGRSVEELFEHGIYPWNGTTTGSLKFPTGVNNHESALTNTGYNPWFTFAYGLDEPTAGHGYIIDAPGGINVDASEHATPTERNVVVFPGGVRREAIKAAFSLAADKSLTFAFNPHYAAAAAPSNLEFDLITSPWSEDNGVKETLNGRIVLNYDKIAIEVAPGGTQAGPIAHRYVKGKQDLHFVLHEGNPDECWYVNGQEKSLGKFYTLPAAEQTAPIIIVYRGPGKCQLHKGDSNPEAFRR